MGMQVPYCPDTEAPEESDIREASARNRENAPKTMRVQGRRSSGRESVCRPHPHDVVDTTEVFSIGSRRVPQR